MGKGSAGSKPLIEIKYNYDALEEFVASVKDRFSEHEARIVALEQQQVVLAGKNSALERTLLQREEEIRVLRGECKQLAQQAVEVEEQNQALREENALAFTKIYKKLESSATSEGLQKEMLSLKEGTDNRMLVLENLMREIGGDKMKTLISDVGQVQSDVLSLWSENARMILEVESRAHVDQLQTLQTSISDMDKELKTVKSFTSDAAVASRKAEIDTLRDAVSKVMGETQVNSKLVRACVERTDQTVMAKADTDKSIDALRGQVSSTGASLGEAQNLVRALLGAQKRFAVELDNLSSTVRSSGAGNRSSKQDLGALPQRPASAQGVAFDRDGTGDLRASTSMGFSSSADPGSGGQFFPPGKVRRPHSAMAMQQPGNQRPSSARNSLFQDTAQDKQQRAAVAKRAGSTSSGGSLAAWPTRSSRQGQAAGNPDVASTANNALHPLPSDVLAS